MAAMVLFQTSTLCCASGSFIFSLDQNFGTFFCVLEIIFVEEICSFPVKDVPEIVWKSGTCGTLELGPLVLITVLERL